MMVSDVFVVGFVLGLVWVFIYYIYRRLLRLDED